jgi:iron(III) transport system ATP-binding protein
MSTASADPVLRVTGVDVTLGTTPVLADVSLDVPAHRFVAVLGASGSGKTTLLRTIAGFERVRAGTVELDGRVVDDPGQHVPPEQRGLGYVPQEGALFPHLTVAANVGFGLRRRHRSRARVDELLDLVGLRDLGRRYPHQLSGGQQQRVAIARALALEPRLVLLDEPFASLDAALRMSVREEIARVLRDAGTAVVLVTHDQQEALSLADQVAVLRAGTIAQIGEPRAIYAHPVDPEMAAFLGEANLVRAQLDGAIASTALGSLRVEPIGERAGMVLLRPEQIAVATDGARGGLAATVVGQTFHGHDSMLDVHPVDDCGTEVLRVRITGTARYEPGTMVWVSATGDASVWPIAP